MKKSLYTLVVVLAFTIIFPAVALAADVPDIRGIAPNNIVLHFASPAEGDNGVYEYTCNDNKALVYTKQYVQLLTKRGLKIVGSDNENGNSVTFGLIIPNKNVPAVEFYAVPPCHILVQGGDDEIQIRLAQGITYGDWAEQSVK